MKNLKIYKSALAILTASSIVLFSGCTGEKDKTKESSCTHLTVCFEDLPVTFKECDGYKIDEVYSYGRLIYTVEKDNKELLTGSTNQFNIYIVNHNNCNNLLEEDSIQKTK